MAERPARTGSFSPAAGSMIPPDAPVSAGDGLAIWLANRHTITDFPNRFAASCYVVHDHEPYLNGPTHPDRR